MKTTNKKTKKTSSKKTGAMGRKIMKEAKRIYNASSGMTWRQAVGKAAKKVAKK